MLKRLNENSIFEELYCLILMLIAFLFYCISSLAGMIIILLIAILSLILFKDFKYIIPCLLYFMFSNSNNFDKAKLPIPLFICGVIFIVILIVFMIKNKTNFSQMKSAKGILLLGIAGVFPILWHNIIKEGEEVLYLLYLGYLFFFMVYAIFAGSLKKDCFSILYKAMTYLGILIALECAFNVLMIHFEKPNENIFNFWYYIGWGLCNEAGIMMCFCLPFSFISIIKANKNYKVLLGFLKAAFITLGMLLTTSRGTILFGLIELAILAIYTLIVSKKRICIAITYFCVIIAMLVICQCMFGINNIIADIKEYVFFLDLSDNGRFGLWNQAINLWKQDFVRMTFGSGIVAEFLPDSYRYVVYHSTFFQVLATMGNLGVAFIIIHFVEKYKQLKVFDKSTIGILLIGYLVVDLYGMLDNTYGMYYYMIPLMIVMAVIDVKAFHNKQIISI